MRRFTVPWSPELAEGGALHELTSKSMILLRAIKLMVDEYPGVPALVLARTLSIELGESEDDMLTAISWAVGLGVIGHDLDRSQNVGLA